MDERATRTTGAGSAWPVVVSAVSWVLTAGLALSAWGGLRPEPTADEATLDTVRAEAGDLAGGGTGAPYPTFVLVVVAVLLAAAAVALALRMRVARVPAVVLAAVAVVLLALAARWETVPVMILLVIGTVPLLTPAALRRLR